MNWRFIFLNMILLGYTSFLVNLRHIFNIDRNKDEIIFKQGFRLNMSKNYKQTVDEKLTQYLRKTK